MLESVFCFIAPPVFQNAILVVFGTDHIKAMGHLVADHIANIAVVDCIGVIQVVVWLLQVTHEYDCVQVGESDEVEVSSLEVKGTKEQLTHCIVLNAVFGVDFGQNGAPSVWK